MVVLWAEARVRACIMSSSYHLVPASEGAQGMGGRAAAAPATWAGSESPWRRRGTFPFAAGCALTVLLSLLAGPVPVTARGGNQYAVLDEVRSGGEVLAKPPSQCLRVVRPESCS